MIYGPCELRVRAARKRNTTRCRVRRYGRSVGLSITADVTVAIEPIAIVEATQRLLYIDWLAAVSRELDESKLSYVALS